MKNTIFFEKTIGAIIDGYRTKEFSPEEIAQVCIANFQKLESRFQAWECFAADKLLSQARNAAEFIAKGGQGDLVGIPVGVKDIFNTADFPTQMGSPLWKDFTPGNDARAVFNLKRAGALIPGKTVTAEFAVHTLNQTLNPHDVSLTPGTSSSGSAVAVALGMVPVAIGTQTAGSIVRPASFCGVYGCKPSFGTIPRTGSLKTTDSLDTVGFFTARNQDLRRVFDALRVHGRNYPLSDAALNDVARQNCPADRSWRVLFARTSTWPAAPAYAREALEEFMKKLSGQKNIEVFETDLPAEISRAHKIHETIYNKSLSYYFKHEFQKAEFVSPIMNELIGRGQAIATPDYHQALDSQTALISLFDEFMADYDILISLSTAGEAPLRHELELPDPALIWTLTHLPVVSAPVFVSPLKRPFGLQLAARKYNDYLLFNFIDYLTDLGLLPAGSQPSLKDLSAV